MNVRGARSTLASSSSRAVRERKPKKTDANFKYLNDDESLGEEEESFDEAEVEGSESADSEEEKPLMQRKLMVRTVF